MIRILLFLFIINNVVAQVYVVTAFCNNFGKGCTKCCGKWAKYNKTASGNKPRQGVTCAAPRHLPFGTKINIPGVGTRIVEDRLHQSHEGRIDVYFNSHKEAKKFGLRKLPVIITPNKTNQKN